MAAFRFGLQKVLELREESEKKSAVGLAQARKEAADAERARHDLEAVRDAGRARVAQARGAGGPVGHLQNLLYVVDQMDGKIAAAETVCRAADEEVSRSMDSFREAVRQRSAIGQLKERRMGQWRTEEAQKEQKEMDEVALTRHARVDGTNVGSGD
ncbi:MAG: flagellar export protein FliJ [Longimicrobiales bacterium]